MDKKTSAEHLLSKLYESIDRDKETSAKIRNWCITVWLGSLAFVLSPKFSLSPLQSKIFPFFPIMVFWVLDAFQNSFIYIHGATARKIESALANDEINELEPNELYFLISYDRIQFSMKLKSFVRALVAKETVAFFYIILLLSTAVALYL